MTKEKKNKLIDIALLVMMILPVATAPRMMITKGLLIRPSVLITRYVGTMPPPKYMVNTNKPIIRPRAGRSLRERA